MKNLINWNKPKKLRSTKNHNDMHVSDSGIPGTFVPNMDEKDQTSWKGKFIKHRDGKSAQVELRKTFSGANLLIIVGNDGFNYKHYRRESDNLSTMGKNIFISMNGGLQLTFEDFADLYAVVQEAKAKIKTEFQLYIVRLYDRFDNIWVDICDPCSKEVAKEIWNEKTDNGKHNTCFEDMDYYDIFPTDTDMLRRIK